VPAKQQPDDRQFKIGDKVRVSLHHGKIEDAIIRAVIQHIDGIRLQVSLGSAWSTGKCGCYDGAGGPDRTKRAAFSILLAA
jgi:hypothetical protein